MVDETPVPRVARKGHPPFLAAALAFAAVALACLAIESGAATGNGYRLAGTLAVGREFLAFIEYPGGGQVLVREGTALEGGVHVTHVDAERVTLAFPGATLDLWLDGSGRPAPAPASAGVVRQRSDEGHVHVRHVDTAGLHASLATPLAAGPTTPLSGNRPDAGTELARRFAPILDLPAGARVVAVNERPVRTADGAIELINTELTRNTAVRLNLASPAGAPPGRVYLLPVRP